MPIELRFKREQVQGYMKAVKEGLPLEPPKEGWTVQELITLSALAHSLAHQRICNEALAGCESREEQEFYLRRTLRELDAALECARGSVGDWQRHNYPDVSAVRIACEDVDQPAKPEFLNE